jgi:hypothetical protein
LSVKNQYKLDVLPVTVFAGRRFGKLNLRGGGKSAGWCGREKGNGRREKWRRERDLPGTCDLQLMRRVSGLSPIQTPGELVNAGRKKMAERAGFEPAVHL